MTIVVATDFSPCSRTATRLAAALARRQRAGLLLLNIIEPLPVDPAAPPMGGAWEGEVANAAKQALDGLAQEFRKQGLTVEVQVQFGAAAQVILDVAADAKAGLIVVGTHGRRGAARLFLGSCAEDVVRRSPCPVLVSAADAAASLERFNQSAPLGLTVVTDGSRASESAFHWVRTSGVTSKVSLVRLYWPPQEAAHYGLEEPWQDRDGHPELLRLLDRDLRRDARSLLGASDPPVRFTVAQHDSGEAIRHDVRQLGADAIVVAVPAHRRGPMTGALTRSTVASVLRASVVPVFCIPEQAHPADRHIPVIRTVLIPCDLSEASLAGVPAAYGLLAGGGRAELLYIHARELLTSAETGLPPRPPLTDDERSSIEARLRAAVPPGAAEHGIATHVSVVEGDSAVEGILQAAERSAADAIAIGSHGRTGLKRGLLGSVAEAVARHSSRPVLIVRAGAAR